MQSEVDIGLGHVGILEALVGLFGAVQVAVTDTDVVLFAAPQIAADIDAARVGGLVVDQCFIGAECKANPGTENVA